MTDEILWRGIAHTIADALSSCVALLKTGPESPAYQALIGVTIAKGEAAILRNEHAKACALPEQQQMLKASGSIKTPIVQTLLAFDRTRGMDCDRFIRDIYRVEDGYDVPYLTDKLMDYCGGNTISAYGILDFYASLDGNNRAAFDRWIYNQ